MVPGGTPVRVLAGLRHQTEPRPAWTRTITATIAQPAFHPAVVPITECASIKDGSCHQPQSSRSVCLEAPAARLRRTRQTRAPAPCD
jgi:hypothetical protein